MNAPLPAPGPAASSTQAPMQAAETGEEVLGEAAAARPALLGPLPLRRLRRKRHPAARRDNPFFPREQRSLFGEILDWMFAPLMLLWPLSVAITFVVARSLTDAPFDRALTDRVSVLREQLFAAEGMIRAPMVQTLDRFARLGDGSSLRLQVAGADGRTLAGDIDLPRPALYDFPAPGRVQLRNVLDNGVEWRIAYTWTSPPGIDQGEPVLIQVAETPETREQLASEIIRGVLFPQFLILPVALLLVWFGLSRGLAPLKQLQEKIEARRPDDPAPINPKDAPEELAPLVDAFNDLLRRQTHTMQNQRRFIADAAHQLKTPLAGLRTQSELALRETEPRQLRETLARIAASADRSAHTVSQLLALARTENLREAITMEVLDLAALVRSVVADHYAHSLARGLDLGYDGGESVANVIGHPVLLREMVGNLIDNALRYTPAQGFVTARVRSFNSRVVLEIEDDGIGIGPADRELVFERFFRVLGGQADGSGLGLSIVREIAWQHGASISIADGLMWPAHRGAGTGTRFIVEFPEPSDPES